MQVLSFVTTAFGALLFWSSPRSCLDVLYARSICLKRSRCQPMKSSRYIKMTKEDWLLSFRLDQIRSAAAAIDIDWVQKRSTNQEKGLATRSHTPYFNKISCRVCGCKLTAVQQCLACKEPSKWRCEICDRSVDSTHKHNDSWEGPKSDELACIYPNPPLRLWEDRY